MQGDRLGKAIAKNLLEENCLWRNLLPRDEVASLWEDVESTLSRRGSSITWEPTSLACGYSTLSFPLRRGTLHEYLATVQVNSEALRLHERFMCSTNDRASE